MAYVEESIFWGHEVYRHGELLRSGKNPIPENIVAQATEIRWIESEPVEDVSTN